MRAAYRHATRCFHPRHRAGLPGGGVAASAPAGTDAPVSGRRHPAGAQSQPGDARAAPRDRRVESRSDHGRPQAQSERVVRRRWLPAVLTATNHPGLSGQRRQLQQLARATPSSAAASGRTASRWPKTRPTSPRRPCSTPSGSCDSRPRRRSSTCCSRSRRWTSRRQNLKSFSEVVDVNRQRVHGRRPGRGRVLQDLAAEAAVRAGRLRRRKSALVQAKAALRQTARIRHPAGGLRRRRRSGVRGPHARPRRSEAPGARRASRPAGRAERRQARAGHARARAQQPGARRQRRRRLRAHRPRQHVRRRRLLRSADSRPQPGQHRAQRGAVRQATEAELATRSRSSPTSSTAYAALADQPEGRRALSVRLPRSGAAVARHHDATSTSAAPARCSICSTPSARIATRSSATARRWRPT